MVAVVAIPTVRPSRFEEVAQREHNENNDDECQAIGGRCGSSSQCRISMAPKLPGIDGLGILSINDIAFMRGPLCANSASAFFYGRLEIYL
jgi:hypothetical protein